MEFLTPLTEAMQPIPSHAVAALLALVIGGVQLFRKKGGPVHRWMGRIWVGLMAYVVLSSLFIWKLKVIGLFSPIHLLSILTLGTLVVSLVVARRRNISLHKKSMKALYFLALVLTGLFTLLPGRVMYDVLLELK